MDTADTDADRLADAVGWAALDVYDRARDDPGAMLADTVRRMGMAAIAVVRAATAPPDRAHAKEDA